MIALDRRGVIAGLAGATALPGAARAAPQSTTLRFNVLRNGKPFGRYSVAFTRDGGVVKAVTDVAMSARIAGVTVFDYQHRCEETWRDGRLVSMRSHSIRDKQADQQETVIVTRSPVGGLQATTNRGDLLLPAEAAPLTHWNRATLQGPLFNPQTGLMLRLTAQSLGPQDVLFAGGARVKATRWRLSGETQIDEWYDAQGTWVGLRGTLPDSSTVAYQRV